MSNTVGRTFEIEGKPSLSLLEGTWALEINTKYWYSDDEDYPELDDPREGNRLSEIVGQAGGHIRTFAATGKGYGDFGHLHYGNEPFGAVLTETVRERKGWVTTGKLFIGARPIVNGQWGAQTALPKITTVRESPAYWDRYICKGNARRRRNLRRGNSPGWVRLTELAELVELPVLEVVQRYFEFTACGELDPALHMVQGTPDYIRRHSFGNNTPTYGITPMTVYSSTQITPQWADACDETTWVRRGWAAAVLRMHALGYIPEISPRFFPSANG
jgi:hypothetical protein